MSPNSEVAIFLNSSAPLPIRLDGEEHGGYYFEAELIAMLRESLLQRSRAKSGRDVAAESPRGDSLRSNRRRPMLTLVEDTSRGVHDTLIAACDRYRYEQLGHVGHHDNCTDNLAAALAELGLTATETPSPLNLFMNIPVHDDQAISFDAPVSTPGSRVSLRAEMDLVIAFSACPQDLVQVNGAACAPTDAHFRIEDARPG